MEEGKWQVTDDANALYDDMARHLKRVAKDILEETKGNRRADKGSWWWNELSQKDIIKKFASL